MLGPSLHSKIQEKVRVLGEYKLALIVVYIKGKSNIAQSHRKHPAMVIILWTPLTSQP